MPDKLNKLDLASYGVPREATGIMFEWELSPADARAVLYRTPDDIDPKVLTGNGAGRIGVVEPQTLYFRTEHPTEPYVRFNLSFLGHEALEG